jgi:hypothetical protein
MLGTTCLTTTNTITIAKPLSRQSLDQVWVPVPDGTEPFV